MMSDTNGINSIQLPVIDISPWLSTNTDHNSSVNNNEATQLLRTETVEKVKHACETVGFFIVQVPNNLQKKTEKSVQDHIICRALSRFVSARSLCALSVLSE